MSFATKTTLIRRFCQLTFQQRNASQIGVAKPATSQVSQQPNLISESRLQSSITDEENNREIVDLFLENLAQEQSELKTVDMMSLSSSEISEARKLKAQTGVATYRKIIYSEGELDNSSLDQPPSVSNPHPFDPSLLPPVHSHTMVPFVNHSPVLRLLVDIGVDLAEVEKTAIGRYLMRLRMEDIKEKVEFMQNSIGMKSEQIGGYLTKNPYFLLQNVDDMQTRLNYLEMKKFTKSERTKIVMEYRYWLNCNVELIDSRLGWIQKNFKLTAKLTRFVIVKEPRIIMFGLGPLERLVQTFVKELNFTENQLKTLILEDPRLFMMDPKQVTRTYRYIRDVMHINNDTIVENPFILRCSLSVIRLRHEFLKKVGRSNYELSSKNDSKKDKSSIQEGSSGSSVDFVRLEHFLSSSDANFAVLAAKTYPVVYDRFLRNS